MSASGLRPYPAYRDSGFPWLGKVPEHWNVLPAKRALRPESSGGAIIKNTASKVPKGDYVPAFSASGQDIWLRSPSHHGDALVLSAVGARCGKTFQASGDWGVVANTHVLRPQTNQNREFWWYVTNTQDWWERAGAAQPFVRVRATLDRPWTYPPDSEEQTTIARFLDHADRRIRRYIRAKERLIELLEERKRALIHGAVTGQIDVRTGQPYPAYEDSGVEWLGKVPEHWEAKRIKTLARSGYKTFVDGDWIESPYITSDGIRLIQTGNVGIGEYREQGFRYISQRTFDEFGCTEFDPGDVLICRLGLPVARACLAPSLGKRMITSVDVCILRPRGGVSPAYLVYTMSSRRYLGWVASLVRGSTRDRVSRSMLGGFTVPVPPSSEQNRVADYLDEVVGALKTTIRGTEQSITLIRQYRARLIADVVTGKLDVREAAAVLLETDPLPVGDRSDGIDPESSLSPTKNDMAKEVYA